MYNTYYDIERYLKGYPYALNRDTLFIGKWSAAVAMDMALALGFQPQIYTTEEVGPDCGYMRHPQYSYIDHQIETVDDIDYEHKPSPFGCAKFVQNPVIVIGRAIDNFTEDFNGTIWWCLNTIDEFDINKLHWFSQEGEVPHFEGDTFTYKLNHINCDNVFAKNSAIQPMLWAMSKDDNCVKYSVSPDESMSKFEVSCTDESSDFVIYKSNHEPVVAVVDSTNDTVVMLLTIRDGKVKVHSDFLGEISTYSIEYLTNYIIDKSGKFPTTRYIATHAALLSTIQRGNFEVLGELAKWNDFCGFLISVGGQMFRLECDTHGSLRLLGLFDPDNDCFLTIRERLEVEALFESLGLALAGAVHGRYSNNDAYNAVVEKVVDLSKENPWISKRRISGIDVYCIDSVIYFNGEPHSVSLTFIPEDNERYIESDLLDERVATYASAVCWPELTKIFEPVIPAQEEEEEE